MRMTRLKTEQAKQEMEHSSNPTTCSKDILEKVKEVLHRD